MNKMQVELEMKIKLDIPDCKKCLFLDSSYGFECLLKGYNWGTKGGYTDIMDAEWIEPPEMRPSWCPLGDHVNDELLFRLKDVITYMNGTWGRDSVVSIDATEIRWNKNER